MDNYIAYIQKVEGIIPDDWLYSAFLGFKNLGFDIKFFEKEADIQEGKNTVVVGYIEESKEFMNRVFSWGPPSVISYHKYMEEFFGRRVREITVRDSKHLDIPDEGLFVKPLTLKEFPSGVIKDFRTLSFLFEDKSFRSLIISDVVDIVSEYRVFVNNSKIVGMQHYKGDYLIFPDPKIIKEALNKSTQVFPQVSYTLDFGILSNGKTILVEANDGWSVANYGLDPIIYAKFLRDRWFQIKRDRGHSNIYKQ